MRNITSLFDDYASAKQAVTDLEAAGVPSEDISIVSNNIYDNSGDAVEDTGIGAGIGAAIGGTGGLLTGLGLLALPGVGPVVAAGWLVSTMTGLIGGAIIGGAAGGLIGSLTQSGVAVVDANLYAEALRRGGTIVSVLVADRHYDIASDILGGVDSVDITERRNVYQQEGWDSFDVNAEPYSAEEIQDERNRNGLKQ